MKFLLVGAGPIDNIPKDIKDYEKEGYTFIGVDKGAYYLKELNIIPKAIFGDFDSYPEQSRNVFLKETTIFTFSPQKDESDTELAIDWCCREGAVEIVLVGMTGGRLDHEWCNIGLAWNMQKKYNIPIKLIDYSNEISFYNSGSYEIENNKKYTYISFLPLCEQIVGLSLTNFVYKLVDKTVDWGTTLTVSNEFIGEKGSFSFKQGILMVIRSCDKEK